MFTVAADVTGRGATVCSGVAGLLSSEVLLDDASMLVQLLEELAGWLSLRECLIGVVVADELADDELLYLPAAEYDRFLYSDNDQTIVILLANTATQCYNTYIDCYGTQ